MCTQTDFSTSAAAAAAVTGSSRDAYRLSPDCQLVFILIYFTFVICFRSLRLSRPSSTAVVPVRLIYPRQSRAPHIQATGLGVATRTRSPVAKIRSFLSRVSSVSFFGLHPRLPHYPSIPMPGYRFSGPCPIKVLSDQEVLQGGKAILSCEQKNVYNLNCTIVP